jgi:hypothetical protein
MATIGRKKSKPRSVTAPPKKPFRPVKWRIPVAMMIRMFALGSVAVIASGYAIWRHYTLVPLALRPRPAATTTTSAAKTMTVLVDGGEVEIEMLP